jgi:glutamyl-tRNA(Gln) amidotransferase subunit D
MPASHSSAADAVVAEAGVEPGDRVRLARDDETYEGIVMPRHGFSGEDTIVLKLDSGYNIGLTVTEDAELELVEEGTEREATVPELPDRVDDLPEVALLGTGGTIASFVEYRTGAVHPATSPEELAAAVPEAFEHAQLSPEIVFETFSEDLRPSHWNELATAVEEAFEDGAEAVVVTHGTDTMHYTAAALGMVFDQLPGPVVLVGAQRSSDRPSSDAATNLTHAVQVAAEANMGEVVIVMHEGMGDDRWAIHPAGRARKMHTSRRDAFQSLNAPPIGYVEDEIVFETDPIPAADAVERTGAISADVGMVQSYPNLSSEEIEAAAGEGLVVAGTGLGHVNRELVDTIDELVDEGTIVAVASQCLNGRTNLYVYETGRQLVQAGCIEAGDILPETAFVKLAWAIEASDSRKEAIERFSRPRAREQSDRSPFYYPKEEIGDE